MIIPASLYISRIVPPALDSIADGDALILESTNLTLLQNVVAAERFMDFQAVASIQFLLQNKQWKTPRFMNVTHIVSCSRGHLK